MTVRVTTLKGADAGAYYVEQLPNYYLQSGEPRGVWLGDGAPMLGLAGEVDDGHFLAVMAGMDPQHPGRHLGRRYEDKSVRGFDVTASAPKSVSILFAFGGNDVRREVLDAHDAAVTALAGWIERHAHTRYRIGGEVAVVDAEGIVAAMFRQHTSRALDPQIHTHLVIANRVKSPDGRWLALDARTIKKDQRTLSAIYHGGLRAELTDRLGVRWHSPENGIAEIADVPEALILEFSARTGGLRRRLDEKLDRFIGSMGRQPTPRERWRLEREAAIDSRPTKARSADAAQLHDEWREQARAIGMEPSRVIEDAVEQVLARSTIGRDLDDLIADWAVDTITEQQSTWRPTELAREVAALCPTETAADAEAVVRWADGLADRIAVDRCVDISKPIPPDAMLRRDGRPVTESALDRALTTQAILDQEHSLVMWADHRLRHNGRDEPAAAQRSGVALAAPQADAACAVAGDADLVLVVGPAGTGKTTALAPAVDQLQAVGRTVFGVAPSAAAADVLSEETGVVADTLDKLIIEHRLSRPPDHCYDLPVGSTVIVDEAGMLPTDKLVGLANLADTKGGRLALVGDPLQFSAVGRGGMFGLMVDTFGAIELDRVHRFEHEWEREASLRLRRGDIEVAEIYDRHGRLHGGTVEQMERASVDRWWELRQAGKRELLLTPTNEVTDRLNVRCQRLRVRAGEIDPEGRSIDVGPYRLHGGDEIVTRQNDRHLRTDRDEMVRNRATWTVQAINRDGSLTATGKHGIIHLPAPYVAEHVELGYAHTVMASQGRNVCGGILFAERAVDLRTLYVAMTRGTAVNEAFVATTGEQTALDVMVQSMTTDWIDQPATVRRAELNQAKLHRPGLLDGPMVLKLRKERDAIRSRLGNADAFVRSAPQKRRELEQRIISEEAAIAKAERTQAHAAKARDEFDRPLHRRKHQADIEWARQEVRRQPDIVQLAQAEIGKARAEFADLDRRVDSAQELLRQRPQLDARVATITRQLDHDLAVRTRIARLEQPEVIIARLGTRPHDPQQAQRWDRAAGQVHQQLAAVELSPGPPTVPGSIDWLRPAPASVPAVPEIGPGL